MKNLLKNPKARIAVLAVLVLGGAYYYMRNKSAAATDPTAGLPVNPTTTTATDPLLGSSALPLGDMGTGIAAPPATAPSLYSDLGLATAVNNVIDTLNAAAANIGGGSSFPVPDPAVTNTGASNPTGATTASGDGSAAAPGNAAAAGKTKAAAKATLKGVPRFVPATGSERAHWAFPGGQWAPAPKKKKKKNAPNGRVSVSRSGAVTIIWPSGSSYGPAVHSGGGGYTPPPYAGPAIHHAAAAYAAYAAPSAPAVHHAAAAYAGYTGRPG